jgi:hypothetical protein
MGKRRQQRRSDPITAMEQRATEVAKRVELRDIRLISTSYHQKPLARKRDGKAQAAIFCKATGKFDRERSAAIVRAHFSLNILSEETQQPMAEVKAEFRAAYALKSCEGLSQDDVQAFGQTNGVFNLWPYWRELVQSAFARMGLPHFIMPVYRLGRAAAEKKPALRKKE